MNGLLPHVLLSGACCACQPCKVQQQRTAQACNGSLQLPHVTQVSATWAATGSQEMLCEHQDGQCLHSKCPIQAHSVRV